MSGNIPTQVLRTDTKIHVPSLKVEKTRGSSLLAPRPSIFHLPAGRRSFVSPVKKQSTLTESVIRVARSIGQGYLCVFCRVIMNERSKTSHLFFRPSACSFLPVQVRISSQVATDGIASSRFKTLSRRVSMLYGGRESVVARHWLGSA